MKNNKGFTLIEILIVISILMALTFVGVLHYTNVLEENNKKIDIMNAKTIAEGVKLAGLSGTINLKTNVLAQTIDSKVNKYIEGDFKPQSKEYSGDGNAAFTYNVQDGKISVHANGKQVYPITNN